MTTVDDNNQNEIIDYMKGRLKQSIGVYIRKKQNNIELPQMAWFSKHHSKWGQNGTVINRATLLYT